MTTRSLITTHIAELFDTQFGPNSTENLVEEVLPYIPSGPGGKSPVIAVGVMGSQPLFTKRAIATPHEVHVYTYVLYTHPEAVIDEDASWTVNQTLFDWVVKILAANKVAEGIWVDISLLSPTFINVIPFDNQGYLVETIPLEVKALN